MDPLIPHKSLPVLVLPLGASLLLLAAALRWRSRALIGCPLALLWILSSPVVADNVMRSLEDRYPYRPNAACPEADAVFVLGGGILGPRDRPGGDVQWGASADRFARGQDLYSNGRAHVLVLSAEGGLSPGAPGVRLKEFALQRGIPPESIMLTRDAPNTAAEADALTGLATRMHWKRVLLVTSAYHMPRAMLLFRGCPAEIVPVPADYQTPDPKMLSSGVHFDQFLPHAEALFRSERALREYWGIMFYSVVRR